MTGWRTEIIGGDQVAGKRPDARHVARARRVDASLPTLDRRLSAAECPPQFLLGHPPHRSEFAQQHRISPERRPSPHTKSVLETQGVVYGTDIRPNMRLPYNSGMSAINIRELREKRGLTQQQLADLLGTSQPQVWRLESGEIPLKKLWIKKLSKALDVHPRKLSADLALKPDEESLLDIYGQLSESQKAALLQVGHAMVEHADAGDRSNGTHG